MGWHYKSPLAFPAAHIASIRSAATNLNEPFILGSFTDIKKANILQEKFRWLKWCVRQEPSITPDLASIISNFDVRTFIQEDKGFGYILYLIIRPTKVSEFISLNPELAKEVLLTID